MLEATNDKMTSALLPPARYEAGFDPSHRPAYHFVPSSNWMNDPNGLIYWNNQYHLFYQYNPVGPFWGTIHWGHAVSDDLVHWRDLPIALAPTPGQADTDGCWSGCAIDNNGVPTLIYTGVQGDLQLPCLATSLDKDLQTWEKYQGNPVLTKLPALDLVAFRDPMVWSEGEDWYMLIGSGIKEVGGTALLFKSSDLTDWTYLHPLSVGDVSHTEPIWSGPLWECPQLINLVDKHVLTFGVWDTQPLYSIARIGTYANERFTTLHEQRLDFGDDYFYAPQTLLEPAGRAIMWGWIKEGRNEPSQAGAGWAGVMSLPRVLCVLPDNTLGVEPAPELKALRKTNHHFEQFQLAAHAPYKLAGVQGDCLEIMTEVVMEEQSKFKIVVRSSFDEKDQVIISYDRQKGWIGMDTAQGEPWLKEQSGGTLTLASDEPLSLHIFIDRSVIEVFANDRACITGRFYPGQPDSLTVHLATSDEAGVEVLSLNVWEIGSIWSNS